VSTSNSLISRSRVLIAALGLTVVLVAVLLFRFDPCDRVDSSDPFAKARCRIHVLIEEKKIAAFQVAVARDGEVIYEEAFGWANVEKRIPATTATLFLAGSIAKPFTSTALMILAERGQVDLNAPVNRYLTGSGLTAYQGRAEDATVARLLLHTTGLPYGYYIAGDEVPQKEKRTDRDLMELAGVLVAAPGTRYQYTNIGYGLFDDMVRNVTGESLKSFVQREVVTRLGLGHTRFLTADSPWDSVATQNADGGVLPAAYDPDGYTALYSTAGDLARFGMFHLKAHLTSQEPVLSDSSIDLLWQYRDSAVATTTRRLAWDVQEDYGLLTVQHGGGGPGIHDWLYMIPSCDVVVALMSNARFDSSDPVLKELIAAAVSNVPKSGFRKSAGRGWPHWPQVNPAAFSGRWAGQIQGPKGICAVAVDFDSRGNPRMHIEGPSCSADEWVRPSRDVQKGYGMLLWRFDACIPYLHPYAVHDEVILTLWREGDRLIGSASAAKEKNFGRGENYVLPQYIELSRAPEG
jgi:CubicO group peptidase (beta-lactamase class C family)